MGWINRKRDVAGASSRLLNKPKARSDELVVEEVGDELFVYDQANECAHSLSVAAATVWRACDGEMSAKDLGTKLDMDADTVARALAELDDCNLLDNGQPLSGMTRREATLKTAKVGATAASVPLIFSILAPVPAMAATQAVLPRARLHARLRRLPPGRMRVLRTGSDNEDKICTAGLHVDQLQRHDHQGQLHADVPGQPALQHVRRASEGRRRVARRSERLALVGFRASANGQPAAAHR